MQFLTELFSRRQQKTRNVDDPFEQVQTFLASDLSLSSIEVLPDQWFIYAFDDLCLFLKFLP